MNEFVNSIAEAMKNAMGAELTVFLLSMIPIAEARVAIPFGMTMGMSPGAALGWAFLGTAAVTPILLLILIPIIKALSKTKLFSKLGKFLYDKFEKKSRSIESGDGAPQNSPPDVSDTEQNSDKKHKLKLSKRDLKKMGGTALFVAIPVPLTGVWTGSAVASIIKLGFVKGLISVMVGNAVACSVITLIGWAFKPYVDYITIAFSVIAICVVIFLIVKLVLYKPDKNATAKVDLPDSAVDADENIESTGNTDSNVDNGKPVDGSAHKPDGSD